MTPDAPTEAMPCPFCGREADTATGSPSSVEGAVGKSFARCVDKRCAGHGHSGGTQWFWLEVWNRRAAVPSPDSARLDWLEMAEADVRLRAIGVMTDHENEWSVHPLHRYGDPHPIPDGPVRPTLREAIDAAMREEPGTP